MESTARIQVARRRAAPAAKGGSSSDHHEGDAILRHLTDFLDAFMWQADPAELRITFITSSVQDLLGHPPSRWIGSADEWSANIHPDYRDRVVECVRATGADATDREVEFRAQHADGRELLLRLAVRLVQPPSGESELWGITTDITNDVHTAETLRVAQEGYWTLSAQTAEYRRRALEDPLTKLPNRALFQDRAGAVMRNAERSGAPFAILLMDLDRFKAINDTQGHQTGDVVLRDVALRIRICLRSQDTPARLGGDEFAALLPDVDEDGAVRVASRIVGAMHPPVEVDGVRIGVGISVGIALFPGHGGSAEELLARADAAMYRIKGAGGGYALAVGNGEMRVVEARRPRRRRLFRRLAIGAVATLAIAAGAISPVAQRHPSGPNSASRLDAATVALRGVTDDEAVEAVASAQQTLSAIPWKDVAASDVVGALERLKRTLTGLRMYGPEELVDRVDRLLTSIRQAEIVANLSVVKATSDPVAPKVEPRNTAAPAVEGPPSTMERASQPARTNLVPERP
jgi:diguanylate cyclase (GGDEF)-like protein/PAS domain S-box-containing protein